MAFPTGVALAATAVLPVAAAAAAATTIAFAAGFSSIVLGSTKGLVVVVGFFPPSFGTPGSTWMVPDDVSVRMILDLVLFFLVVMVVPAAV